MTKQPSVVARERALAPTACSAGAPTPKRTNHRRKNHAGYFSARDAVRIVGCEHVDDYRAAVEELVRPDDLALEVGSAGGRTTAALGRKCLLAYGVDKSDSPKMLSEQRIHEEQSANGNVQFFPIDANDIGALRELSARAAREARERQQGNGGLEPHAGFSVIAVDVSGSAKLSTVLELLERYEHVFQSSLRLLLVKSFRLVCVLDRARPFEAVATAADAPAEVG